MSKESIASQAQTSPPPNVKQSAEQRPLWSPIRPPKIPNSRLNATVKQTETTKQKLEVDKAQVSTENHFDKWEKEVDSKNPQMAKTFKLKTKP